MYIILLRFSRNRQAAADHMAGHKAWLAKGFEDGAFLMAGSIGPGQGGAVIARGASLEAVEEIVKSDPFVREDVVEAEILAFAASAARDDLRFLLEDGTTG